MTPDELRVLGDQVARRNAVNLAMALRRLRAGLPLSRLERALIEENITEAVRLTGIDRVRAAIGDAQADAALLRAKAFAVLELPGQTTIAVTLETDAAAAERAAAAEAVQRADALSRESAAAVRATIQDGIKAGTSPAELARQVRDVVGLNRRQADAVQAYRARLEAQDRPDDQVDRMVDRHATRSLTQRAETIAKTETFTALQEGQRARVEAAVQSGEIQPDDWETEWVTAEDERVCPRCGPLDGVRVPLGELFDTDEGQIDGPPLHINCRCLTRTVLAGFRKGEAPSPVRRSILDNLG